MPKYSFANDEYSKAQCSAGLAGIAANVRVAAIKLLVHLARKKSALEFKSTTLNTVALRCTTAVSTRFL